MALHAFAFLLFVIHQTAASSTTMFQWRSSRTEKSSDGEPHQSSFSWPLAALCCGLSFETYKAGAQKFQASAHEGIETSILSPSIFFKDYAGLVILSRARLTFADSEPAPKHVFLVLQTGQLPMESESIITDVVPGAPQIEWNEGYSALSHGAYSDVWVSAYAGTSLRDGELIGRARVRLSGKAPDAMRLSFPLDQWKKFSLKRRVRLEVQLGYVAARQDVPTLCTLCRVASELPANTYPRHQVEMLRDHLAGLLSQRRPHTGPLLNQWSRTGGPSARLQLSRWQLKAVRRHLGLTFGLKRLVTRVSQSLTRSLRRLRPPPKRPWPSDAALPQLSDWLHLARRLGTARGEEVRALDDLEACYYVNVPETASQFALWRSVATKTIYIAFKGTTPTSIKDLMTDLDTRQISTRLEDMLAGLLAELRRMAAVPRVVRECFASQQTVTTHSTTMMDLAKLLARSEDDEDVERFLKSLDINGDGKLLYREAAYLLGLNTAVGTRGLSSVAEVGRALRRVDPERLARRVHEISVASEEAGEEADEKADGKADGKAGEKADGKAGFGCSKAPKLHAGFASNSQKLFFHVVKLLETLAPPGSEWDLCVTGHSLGGALASLFTWQLQAVRHLLVPGIASVSLYTFGSPRTGDQAAQAAFDRVTGEIVPTHRVVNAGDMVPWFPGMRYGGRWRHVGSVVVIDRRRGAWVQDEKDGRVGLAAEPRGRARKYVERRTNASRLRRVASLFPFRPLRERWEFTLAVASGSAINAHLDPEHYVSFARALSDLEKRNEEIESEASPAAAGAAGAADARRIHER